MGDVKQQQKEAKQEKQQEQEAKDNKKQEQQNAEQLVKGKFLLTEDEKKSILWQSGIQYNPLFDNELYVAYADSMDYVVGLYRQMKENHQARDFSSVLSKFTTIIEQIKITEQAIGSKQDGGTLRKIIGDICEYQCSNVGNKGCWPT
ncbi:MAG: hypothetical protein LBG59_00955 [Candidatus Peribacteria bacterium]|nr:hypothetical protein [Candidatus Peribacteria bacterium]